MKILHTADIHIKTSQDKRYMKDLLTSLSYIVELVEQHEPDYVFIAGDLFDTKLPSPEEFAIATRFLNSLLELSKVVITIGNHDLPALKGAHHTLSPLKNLDIKNLYILEEPDIYSVGEIDILNIPYRYFDKQDELNKTFELYNQYTGNNLFLLGHGWVEQYLPIDPPREFVLTKTFLSSLTKIRYGALGHIHKGGMVLPNVYYSGSPFRITTAETEPDKNVILWEDGKVKFLPIPVLPIKILSLTESVEGIKDTLCVIKARDVTVEDMHKITKMKETLEGNNNYVYVNIEMKTVQFVSTNTTKQTSLDQFLDDYIKKNDLVKYKNTILKVLEKISKEEITENTSIFDIKEMEDL